MTFRRLATALVIAALMPAASIARPGAGPVGAAPEAVGARSSASSVSQATGRVESGIVQLTCGSKGGPGIGSRICSVVGAGDWLWEYPFGQPPTGAELAAAKQMLRLDHIEVYVADGGACTFTLGVADPGGALLGFPGPRIRAVPAPSFAARGELSARFHVPGIDMEFTTLFCEGEVRGADVQIYYTRVPRGR